MSQLEWLGAFENYLEEILLSQGKPTGVIFNLKNNFGWVDKQEIEVGQKVVTRIKKRFDGE